jgi:SAM-dependent methyltransferase
MWGAYPPVNSIPNWPKSCLKKPKGLYRNMDILSFSELLTPAGQTALQATQALAPREADFLSHFQKLSREFPRELARTALEVAILRGEAVKKFPAADQMYFSRAALQQATSFEVSTYRADRYKNFEHVFDLGCSLGGDTLALAAVTSVTGLDLDPLRLAMAQANFHALNQTANFIQADLTTPLPLAPNPSALFFDPARRANQRRIFSVKDYQPPLEIIRNWQSNLATIGVKISPGVRLDELVEYECEVEFISLRGELKEAVLWFGALKTTPRRATVLPGPYSVSNEQWVDVSDELSEPRRYLYEPDASILRAGLVQNLAVQLGASQLDPDIAYLTAEAKKTTPFARAWEIEAWFPFQLKRLRAYLRERNVGQVVVKKRGSPLQPEALIRDLRLKGDHNRTIFLTHLCGKPIVIIGFSNKI